MKHRFIVRRRSRKPAIISVYLPPFGVTIWRDGAISLQAFGHFVQIVFGDWWKAMPKRSRP